VSALVGLVLVASTAANVAVHVEETTGMERATEAIITEALVTALAETGAAAVLDERRGPCIRTPACIAEVQRRTGAAEVVALRAVGGATKLRLVVGRVDGQGKLRGTVQLDISTNDAQWSARFGGVIRTLFPEARVAEVEPDTALSVAGWIGFIGAVAAAGAATGLRISSDGIRDDIATIPLDAATLEDEKSTSLLHGGVSNALFGVAAVGLTVGIIELVHALE